MRIEYPAYAAIARHLNLSIRKSFPRTVLSTSLEDISSLLASLLPSAKAKRVVEREDETAQVGANFESFFRESLRCKWKAVCRCSLQNQPWIDIFYWRESREVHVKSVPRGARPSHIWQRTWPPQTSRPTLLLHTDVGLGICTTRPTS